MKKFATVLLSMVVFASISNAQWSYTYSGNDSYYDDYDYNNYDEDNDRYNKNSYDKRRGDSYKSNRRIYKRMTPRDQKRYRKLLRSLQDRQERAWDDGYLSQREKRRIREIRRDINNLMARYQRNNNSRGYRSNSCR